MDYRFEDVYDRITTLESAPAGSGGGINEVNVYPENFSLDDTDTGSDAGTCFDIMPCINFDPDNDGAAWFIIKFPGTWDGTANIDVQLTYSMNGNDPAKDVKFDWDYWCLNSGETPSEGSPDASNTNDLASSSSNIGKVYIQTISNFIDGQYFDTSTDTIVVKIKRDANDAGDTYTGTFQLIKLLLTQ